MKKTLYTNHFPWRPQSVYFTLVLPYISYNSIYLCFYRFADKIFTGFPLLWWYCNAYLMGNLPVGFQFTRIEEAVRNKYEGGGCFAITVTEIGRTGGTGKLLYVHLSQR